MKKQILCGILSATLLLSAIPPQPTQAIPQAYWQYQTPFGDARDNNDHEKVIEYALAIEEIMLPEVHSNERSGILYNSYEALAVSYQALKDYNNAIYYLEKQVEFAKILGYDDAILLAEKRMIQIDPMTEVYAVSQNTSSLPYYGAKYEPKVGTFFGRAREESSAAVMSSESATSFYVECLEEEVSQYDYLISPMDDGTRLIQICLNMPHEHFSLLRCLESSADAYLVRTMEYLAQMQSPVLLRIGAEMNVWTDPTTPEVFREAYIKIAQYAREYAPNVALVFSPNSISSWGLDIMEYYPGDEYVDWVGMSAYTQKYWDPADPNGLPDYQNMFYNTGDYADCIHGLREIVTLFGDKKPILISESGAGYRHKQYNLDLEPFSVEQLNRLYTYANMVFPQIKTIINFDVDYSSDSYQFSMSNNSTLMSAYQSVIQNNPSLLSSVQDNKTTAYIKAEVYEDTLATIQLAAHTAPVGSPSVQVRYLLDGVEVSSGGTMPYICSISSDAVSQGTHSLTVEFRCSDGYQEDKHYSLVKNGDTVTIRSSDSAVTPEFTPEVTPEVSPEATPEVSPEIAPTGTYVDVPDWASTFVDYVHDNGILQGENGYFHTNVSATRGVTAMALHNLSKGEPTINISDHFDDVMDSGFERGISWCVENGVMVGLGSSFGTESNLTREAFATTLRAYADFAGVYVEPSQNGVTAVESFPDAENISFWSKTALAWATENGLMAGYNDGELKPLGEVTRVQMAVILTSFAEKFA